MSKKTLITAKLLRALTSGGKHHRAGAVIQLEESTFKSLKDHGVAEAVVVEAEKEAPAAPVVAPPAATNVNPDPADPTKEAAEDEKTDDVDNDSNEDENGDETAKMMELKEALKDDNIAVLKAAGYVDFESFKDVTLEKLEALDTIGPATAKKIIEILKG